MNNPFHLVTLGLRALIVNVVVFVMLAAGLAWYLGGSLLPNRQAVHFPVFEWMGDDYHFRVIGHGTTPDPVRWELIHALPDGDEERLTLGVDGKWRSVWGPLVQQSDLLIGLEVEAADGSTQWWVAQIDRDRAASSVRVADRAAMESALRQAPRLGSGAPEREADSPHDAAGGTMPSSAH